VNQEELEKALTIGRTDAQVRAILSDRRLLMVVAGAGSGKTDVMARRIAWLVGGCGVPRESIVAFTFTEKAAEEMQFRIRARLALSVEEGEDSTLGGMYVGTIHGFCLKLLRDLDPDRYQSFDVIAEGAANGLVQRGFNHLLGLKALQGALTKSKQEKQRDTTTGAGHFETISKFLQGYSLLHEFDQFEIELPEEAPPTSPGREEEEWCKKARLKTNAGAGEVAEAFAESAARYYAFQQCRRFMDFATAQSEAVKMLRSNPEALAKARNTMTHLVVDEVQDINPIQKELIDLLVGSDGHLMVVGDHRQAIFGWRGGRVELMGELHDEIAAAADGDVVELEENFRSTPRIINVANEWSRWITEPGTMTSPPMKHGLASRVDYDTSHVGLTRFETCAEEAAWIADRIKDLIAADRKPVKGARQDVPGQDDRGLGFEDIVILTRSNTDTATYMHALQDAGIPAVFRGSDLFRKPEVLAALSALGLAAGLDSFWGASWGNSIPAFAAGIMGTTASNQVETEKLLEAALEAARQADLPVAEDTFQRVHSLAVLINRRIDKQKPNPGPEDLVGLNGTLAKDFLLEQGDAPRRLFPQQIYHFLLEEMGVAEWDGEGTGRGSSALFHLGALSGLVTEMESPGWTTPFDFGAQILTLSQWGPSGSRVKEAELLVAPQAVTISTIHSAKGLEFGAVFLADVKSQRFPNSYALRKPDLPFDGPLIEAIDPASLADNDNRDDERRLMYVALTRAERYLFISGSGKEGQFAKDLQTIVLNAGGTFEEPHLFGPAVDLLPWRGDPESRLATSFSDLRYYLECPHDFYLRKVLGFAPTIDQAFGYGRAVHNLMRAVHSDSGHWASISHDPALVEKEVSSLVERGLFYLRYTTGAPLNNMREKAIRIVTEYVTTYGDELASLDFEAEREFQTLLEEDNVLISGAIDMIRHDNLPSVTLVDFKSGEVDSELSIRLAKEQMQLQISIYGIAARAELEYSPEQGLVRYLGESDPKNRELKVDLDDASLEAARAKVSETARGIKNRQFDSGPRQGPTEGNPASRCSVCDFRAFCGLKA
jgi:DNA helicase-2/ATP-dependent DNA helicase PcrA